MEKIKWTLNRMPGSEDRYLALMDREQAEKARAFHRSFPAYCPTPLARLKGMAQLLGLKGLYVKDESYRFGLNAFKVLGGSYAIARYIAGVLGRDIGGLGYEELTSEAVRRSLGPVSFYTATDGNHGRGVAWSAARLGQKAVVRMPKGTMPVRRDNIAREGAEVTIEAFNYDDCVRLAAKQAAEAPRGVLVQDTAWTGYETIPTWIMQGYGTMATEADEQIRAAGEAQPTHIFIQAGVGSLAGAVAGYFANRYPQGAPATVVVEAQAADCLYQSALLGDGSIRSVGGDLSTMMAGLACGEPNPISFDILRNHASLFASCPDWVSAKGMRLLGAPLKGDPQVISGESGAVGMGLLWALMTRAEYQDFRQAIGLDERSVVLLFSTEGDTDPEHYRKILWGGGEC